MHARLFGSAALAALTLTAQPAQASTILATLGGYVDGAALDGVSASNGDTVTLDATGSGGVTLAGQAMADIGINRLYVANSPGLPFADTNSAISGLSFWADNLVASSGGSDPIQMSVDFAFDGSYVGAPYDSSTFGNAYFVAVKGRLNDISQNAADGSIILHTDAGDVALEGENTALPQSSILGLLSACDGDDGEDGCDPFDVDDTFKLNFAVNPEEEFFLASYFFVGNLAQGEVVDAFHTIKLTGITLGDGAGLASESGKIVSLGNGSFGLANAVPEPATWALMILGFGLVGGVLRQQRRKLRVSYK
jgi:hypothetical protein